MKTKHITFPLLFGKLAVALTALAATVFTASCNNEDLTDAGRSYLQLSVTTDTPVLSRAIVNDKYLPDKADIGVTLTATDGSAYDGKDFINLKYTASGWGDAQTWSSETPASLSTTAGKVVAYYPYNPDITTADGLTAIPVETASQTDYMYAKPVTGINFTSAQTGIIMQHALTNIRINLKKGTYTGPGNVGKVSVKAPGFATNATMHAETGALAGVTGSGAEYIQEFTDLTLSESGYNQDFITVPYPSSTSGDVTIFVTIDDKKFNAVVPYTEAFQQGYSYVYNLTLDNEALTFKGVDVTKWNVKAKEEQVLEFYDNQYIVEIQVPSDGYAFTPNIFGFTGTADWGDGTTTEYNSYTARPEKHTYNTAGIYVFKFKGTITQLNSERISVSGGYIYPSLIITKLIHIGKEVGVWRMTTAFDSQNLLYEIVPGALDGCIKVEEFGEGYIGCFSNCTSLKKIPEGFFNKCTEATSFNGTFKMCTSLQDIPEGLFDNNTKVTSFEGTFSGCTSLTKIPEGLFDHCTEVTTFENAFYNCKKITSIPEGLFDNCTEVTSFNRCFSYCNLTSIPSNLFTNNTQTVSFDGTFYYCSNLLTIPGELFSTCTEVTTFGGTFGNCKKLQAIPAGLFDNNTKVTNFVAYNGLYNTGCFNGCSEVTTIPDGLFDKCTEIIYMGCDSDYGGIFGNCKKLQAIPVGLFDACTKVTDFGFAFFRCENLQSIPEGLFDKCTKATTFTGLFYGCTSLTSIPEGLFDNNTEVTNISNGFYGLFRDCESLTEIPNGLFDSLSKITSASNVFYGCEGLTSIPVGLFDKCTKVTSFQGTFYGCENLKSIPEGLFDNCTKVTSFYDTFWGCSKLTGESPYTVINIEGVDTKVHLYERSNYPEYFTAPTSYSVCFYRCTGLTDYNDIPLSWK